MLRKEIEQNPLPYHVSTKKRLAAVCAQRATYDRAPTGISGSPVEHTFHFRADFVGNHAIYRRLHGREFGSERVGLHRACLYDYVVVHGIMYICGRWICRAGGASSRCQRRQGSSRGIASGACFILTFRFFVGRHRLRYQRIFTPLARWR